MLHHRKSEEPLSPEEQDRLLRDGAKIRGIVMHSELVEADRSRSWLRIDVRFPDDNSTELNVELPNLYQPAPGSPDAERITRLRMDQQLRHAARLPKIQLEVSDGSMIPLRYDPEHRSRIVVDEAALQAAAFHAYIERETRPTTPAAVTPTGPPWTVPTHCPTCGAPVDQATASAERDPHCPFCQAPLPVSPAAAR